MRSVPRGVVIVPTLLRQSCGFFASVTRYGMTLSLSAESRITWRNVLVPVGSAILLYGVVLETWPLFGGLYRSQVALGAAGTLMFGLRAYLDRRLLANHVRVLSLSILVGLFVGVVLFRYF